MVRGISHGPCRAVRAVKSESPFVPTPEGPVSQSNLDKNSQPAPSTPASSPDELIKDLDVTLSETDKKAVVGGGKSEHVYMTIKLTDATIS